MRRAEVAPVSRETAVAIHDMQIARHGGVPGVRDEGLLDAAIAQPWQGFGDVEAYPTLEEKATRLAYEVITQHPFADGNKRTGAALLVAVLRANGARFKPRAADLLAAVMGVASGELDYDGLLAFVRREAGTAR